MDDIRNTLFDDITRTDPRPSRHTESTFSFLNRVHSAPFDRVRSVLEQWFAEWPADNRADIRSRFRSGDNRGFVGAFWELYLHELFRRQGFDIHSHPEVPGSPYHPDFLLSRGEESFYLEATAIHPSMSEETAQKVESAVYDTLNQLNSPNFMLEIEVLARGNYAPPVRRHRKRIENWLGGLSPDLVQLAINQYTTLNSGDDLLPAYDIAEAGWLIRLRPLPKSSALQAKPGVRPLGVFLPFDDGSATDDISPLRRALMRKTKYGPVDKPLVLAILVDLPFIAREDVESALFGSLAIRYNKGLQASDVLSPPQWVRQGDGFFRDGNGPVNREIAAVLIATNLRPWSVASQEFGGLELWPHPWAQQSLGTDLPFDQALFVSEPPIHEIRRTTARVAPRELVGLPNGWPGFGQDYVTDANS